MVLATAPRLVAGKPKGRRLSGTRSPQSTKLSPRKKPEASWTTIPIDPELASLEEPVVLHSSALAAALGFDVPDDDARSDDEISCSEQTVDALRSALLDMKIGGPNAQSTLGSKSARSTHAALPSAPPPPPVRKLTIDYSPWVSPATTPRQSTSSSARGGASKARPAAARSQSHLPESSPRKHQPLPPGRPPVAPASKRGAAGASERPREPPSARKRPEADALSTPRAPAAPPKPPKALHMVSMLFPAYISPAASACSTPRASSSASSSVVSGELGP